MKAPSLKFSYTAGDVDYKHECLSFTLSAQICDICGFLDLVLIGLRRSRSQLGFQLSCADSLDRRSYRSFIPTRG